MTQYIYAAILGVIVALGGAAMWERHGRAVAEQALVAYKQDAALTVARAEQQAADKIAAAEKLNAKTLSDLNADLSGATARADSLSKRLLAYAAHGSGPMPQGGGQPGTAAPSGVSTVSGPVDVALAGYDAACQRDAARFNALIAELTPQL